MQRIVTWEPQITVTATATSVYDLLITAWATASILAADINFIVLNPEAEIRYSSNWTPTAAIGMKIASWGTTTITWVWLKDLKLIRTGASDVLVNIEIGKTSLI